jgi:aspartate/methionine/tyrosine aminotransferase
LENGEKFPFENVVFCNIGNPQSVGNPPISFIRQVCAAVDHPELMEHPGLFPADVIARSKAYLKSANGSVGAYSMSQGLPLVRNEVAEYITNRDGQSPASPDQIFLSDGASSGIKLILELLVRSSADGVMVPIPQYPLYSATLARMNGTLVPVFLNPEDRWALDTSSLDKIFEDSVKTGVLPRGLVVINPGNPTGQCMSEKNIEEIIDFAGRRNLVLLADEVYQDNIYTEERPFFSFRKVLLKSKWKDSVQLASFHSTSKGYYGECGKRGGYMEVLNFNGEAKANLVKLASISLCPNVIGQIATGCVVRPPREGEESYPLFKQQKDEALASLKRRAKILVDALNSLEGVKCYLPTGAMYVFPEIQLPEAAIRAAKEAGKKPDVWYCIKMLDATGICVVPGSGFGMIPQDGSNKYYFRTTFLPPEKMLVASIKLLSDFHQSILKMKSSSNL